MKLKEFLTKHRIAPPDFARDTGIHINSINRYLRGEGCPYYKRACFIEKFTHEEVTVEELMNKAANKIKELTNDTSANT